MKWYAYLKVFTELWVGVGESAENIGDILTNLSDVDRNLLIESILPLSVSGWTPPPPPFFFGYISSKWTPLLNCGSDP